MRISDWSSDVCSSELIEHAAESCHSGPGYSRHLPAPFPARPCAFIANRRGNLEHMEHSPEKEKLPPWAGWWRGPSVIRSGSADRIFHAPDANRSRGCRKFGPTPQIGREPV